MTVIQVAAWLYIVRSAFGVLALIGHLRARRRWAQAAANYTPPPQDPNDQKLGEIIDHMHRNIRDGESWKTGGDGWQR